MPLPSGRFFLSPITHWPHHRWGTIAQAAAEQGVHPDTVRKMIQRGEMHAERVGPRRIRVDLDSLRTIVLSPTSGGDV